MKHSEKLELMYRHMASLGISRAVAAPPAWRLLWALGIEAPPPLFAPFWPSVLLIGAYFGTAWGVVMWLVQWSRRGMPPSIAAGAAVTAGVLFGLCMAVYFRHVARKHHLPSWDEYPGAADP
jgi:hypothetical protein